MADAEAGLGAEPDAAAGPPPATEDGAATAAGRLLVTDQKTREASLFVLDWRWSCTGAMAACLAVSVHCSALLASSLAHQQA